MTIAEVREKCKGFLARLKGLPDGSQGAPKPARDLLIFGIIVLSSTLSYGLGYLSGQGSGSTVQVEVRRAEQAPAAAAGAGDILASKSGTRYYFAHCSGVARISERNKVFFASVAEAEAAGYTRAVNCEPR